MMSGATSNNKVAIVTTLAFHWLLDAKSWLQSQTNTTVLEIVISSQ